MDDTSLAALASAASAGVDLAFAVAVGALATAPALGPANAAWPLRRRIAVARCHDIAVVAAVVLTVLQSWLRTMSFAETGAVAALAQLPSVAAGTQFGRGWAVACAALVLMGAARPGRAGTGRLGIGVAMAGAIVYAGGRAAAGHAGARGSLDDLAVMAIHLLATAIWAGIVFVAAVAVLPDTDPAAAPERLAWHEQLSATAAVALALVIASGGGVAWRTTAGFSVPLRGASWSWLLAGKLALVALAAALGAFNRIAGLPPLRIALAGGASTRGTSAQTRFTRVLRVEAMVLLGALLLGAAMAAVAPPGSMD